MNKTVVLLHFGWVPGGAARFFYHHLRHDYDVLMNEERPNRPTKDFYLNQIAARHHLVFFLSHGTVRNLTVDLVLRQLIEHAINTGRNIVPVQLFGFRATDHVEHLVGGLANILSYRVLDFNVADATNSLITLKQNHLDQTVRRNLRAVSEEDSQQVSAIQARLNALPEATPDQLQAEVYFDAGQAAQQQSDLETALDRYQQAIELDPTHFNAIHNQAIVQQQRGNLAAALAGYNRCVELQPTHASAYYSRANTYQALGDYPHAEYDYARAIELNPNHAAAYNNRGYWLRYGQGDYEGAIADFNAAIRLVPDNATLLDSRAQAFFALGRFQEALADYRRAYDLNPNNKIIRAGLAITYFALDQTRDAERHWRILAGGDKQYMDAEWVGETFGWHSSLTAVAHGLIQGLENRSGKEVGKASS